MTIWPDISSTIHWIHSNFKFAYILSGVIGGVFILSPLCASADNFTQSAGASLGFEYDTNPLLKATDEKSVWRTLISPRYKMLTQTGLNEWSVDAGLDVQRSTDTSILIDRADPSLNLLWRRFLETGEFGVKAHYDKASTRFTELEDSGLVNKDATRNTKSISANWLHNLNERLVLTTNAEYSTVEYDAGNLSNFQTKKLSANLSRLNTETLKTYVQLAYSHLKLDVGGEPTTQVNSILGIQWDVTERITLGANAGINRISGATSGSGSTGGANIAYLTDKSKSSLDVSRSSAPSGLGGFIESDKVKAAWSYELSDKYRTGLDYVLSKNRSLNDTETRQAGLWISHDISEFWSLKLTAQHKESILSSISAKANVIGFTFQYNYPDF